MTKKRQYLLMSFLALWAAEIITSPDGGMGGILTGLGASLAGGIFGLVVGFVFLNLIRFFYNLIKPDNKLEFTWEDKATAGILIMTLLIFFRIF